MFELSFLLPYGPEDRVGTFLPRGENAKNPFSPKKCHSLAIFGDITIETQAQG